MYDPYEYEFNDVFYEDTFAKLYPSEHIVKISHLEINDEYKGKGIAKQLMVKGLKK